MINKDELRNALSSVKHIAISVDDYLLLLEAKDYQKPLSLEDEPLEVDPFHHGLADDIYLYRCEILRAYGYIENRVRWTLENQDGNIASIGNDFIKTASRNDFLELVSEQTTR